MTTDDELIPLDEVVARHGSARRPQAEPRPRPDGVSGDAVAALGTLSATLETAEDARGHLYAFHRLSGRADLDLQDAARALRDAGFAEVSRVVGEVLAGRDVIGERRPSELVDAYDDQFGNAFRDVEQAVRQATGLEQRHVFESGMAREQRDGAT